MRTSSIRRSRAAVTASAALGMLLVGIASVPAHAAGVRDRQWHLDTMGAEKIWQLSTGKGVTVAVIDSGVEKGNPDLPGQVLRGKDFAPEQSGDEFTDYTGHGTNMAGLIAGTGKANGGQGAYGLAPGAKILSVRVPGSEAGAGSSQADADREFNAVMPEAIRFAVDSGAKVLNISQGSTAGSQQLTDAVKYALDKGALVFASVGNSGDKANRLEYPGATPGVVGVGAIDQKLTRIPLSQYGPQVDLVAPGKDTVAACGGGRVCTSSGTSNATALASAAAALIWAKHPDWTNNQVLKVMLNTIAAPTEGDKRNDYIGFGAIRPLRALKTPGDPGPAGVRPIEDLEENVSASPSGAASEGATPAAPSTAAPAPAPAAQEESEGGGSATLYIGIGIGAAVLIAGAVVALRGRRT
ncbi:type VII secretion-associated serine protease mycosin [Streptomyces sp. adm13(2018)]|uniref:type VII secretion-associated serine protease mycosin n=1 Tax=unclassified Streptomyces TaxID=2593676 RepID=UPI0011CE1CBA|nr:type VII secretion-associated serine protease mycosin [Streptomyces sp. adm13(2018)]TXS13605.1 type VII secretion-associated serine protease mycosin [Streptomyces sp. adm13(2018)]